jgi:hypothetical protein
MLRRELVGSVSGLLLLAACKNGNNPAPLPNDKISVIAGDISDIAGALSSVFPSIEQAIGNTNSAAIEKVQQAIADIQSIAAKIKAASDATAAQPFVQQVQADVNAVAEVLAVIPGIPQVVSVTLEAANALLPLLFSLVNAAQPPVPAAARRFTTRGMSPEQARSTLKQIERGRH